MSNKCWTPQVLIEKEFKGHTDRVLDFCLLPNNKLLSCSCDQTFRIFDLETEKCEKVIDVQTKISRVLFWKENNIIVGGNISGDILLYDYDGNSNNHEIKGRREFNVGKNSVNCLLQVDPSNGVFLCSLNNIFESGSLHKIIINPSNLQIRFKELISPVETEKFLVNDLIQLKIHPNVVAFGGDKSGLHYYDWKNEKYQKSFSVDGFTCIHSFVDDKSNKERIVTGQEIKVWNYEDGKIINKIDRSSNRINSIVSVNNNNAILYGDSDGILNFINLEKMNPKEEAAEIKRIFKSELRFVPYPLSSNKFVAYSSSLCRGIFTSTIDFSLKIFSIDQCLIKHIFLLIH